MNLTDKKKLLILTNLYPLPWQKNRATFNKQQFDLLKEKYTVTLLIPVPFPTWYKHRKEIRQSSTTRYFPFFYTPLIGRRFYPFFMFFSIIIHSYHWVRNTKPNIILASWAYPEGVVGCWLARILKSKFFIKVHGSDVNIHGGVRSRSKQIVKASQYASSILSVSGALASKLSQMGVDRKKISVIYNGVNHSKFSRGPTISPIFDYPYVLFVGNLIRSKGVVELMEGFGDASKECPNLRLLFVGSGDMRDELVKKANSMGVSDKVTFFGNVDHERIPPLMSGAKALVLPSYNEGVPNVILESMACGTPVIATRVGGIPEVVKEGVTGILINEKSSSAVKAGLLELLEKPWDSSKIKDYSLRFSWDINRDKVLNMLET